MEITMTFNICKDFNLSLKMFIFSFIIQWYQDFIVIPSFSNWMFFKPVRFLYLLVSLSSLLNYRILYLFFVTHILFVINLKIA